LSHIILYYPFFSYSYRIPIPIPIPFIFFNVSSPPFDTTIRKRIDLSNFRIAIDAMMIGLFTSIHYEWYPTNRPKDQQQDGRK